MSIKLHTSLCTAQQIAEAVKKEVVSQDVSITSDVKKIQAVETLVSKVLPILDKDRLKLLPQKSALALVRDYVAHYPVLKPFIAQLFPDAFPTKTRVYVKCDAGLGHHLFIRGTARGLSWDYGIQMKCIHDDLWMWETEEDNFDYKIVFDDDGEKGWEDKDGNRSKKGRKDKIIAPTFSHYNKSKNTLSEEEISLNRIYKAQAVIEKGINNSHLLGDSQLIAYIDEVMGILCPEGLVLPDENANSKKYALQCVLKYPFSFPFLVQLFPALPIEQAAYLHPDSLKNPVKLATLLAELWKNKMIPSDNKMLCSCFDKIDQVFAGRKEKQLGFQTFIKTMAQLGEIKALKQYVLSSEPNVLIAFELAKFEATRKTPPFLDILNYPITYSKALFAIFLTALGHHRASLESLDNYGDIKLYPNLINACFALNKKTPISEICQLLTSFCESKKWGNIDPILKEILAIKNDYEQKAAFIDLIHFLGCCAIEELTPKSFSYILDKQIIQALLKQDDKVRYLLTHEIIAILKSPKAPLTDFASILFAKALLSRLTVQGMSEQMALKILRAVKEQSKPYLLDLLAELIDCAPYTQEQMNLIEERLAIILSNPLSNDLETLTNLLSIFGKDTFIECLQGKKELKTLFLARLQILFEVNDIRIFEMLFGPIFNDSKKSKTLISQLKKIKDFQPHNKTRALKALYDLVYDLNNLSSSYPKDILDAEIVKMTADIFSCRGFIKDADKDKDHDLRKLETVSEVQGTFAFCKKITQLTEKTPVILSPKYLRNHERLDPTCLTLRYKRLGHVFNKNTLFYPSEGVSRNIEGFSETFCINMLRATFNEFACAKKDIISKETHETVAETLSKAVWNDNVSDEKIAEIHRNIHDPHYSHSILVGSGWDWHSTQIVFRRIQGKLHMFYCNRGADCGVNPGIMVCCIEKEHLITPEFLKRIALRLAVKYADYTSLDKISEELGAPPIQRIPMKAQKVGNCVYTSLKAAIYILLIVSDLTKDLEETLTPIFPLPSDAKILNAKASYKAFSKYDAEVVLEDFLIELNEISIDGLLSEKNERHLLNLFTVTTMTKAWLIEQKSKENSKIGISLNAAALITIQKFEKRISLNNTVKKGS